MIHSAFNLPESHEHFWKKQTPPPKRKKTTVLTLTKAMISLYEPGFTVMLMTFDERVCDREGVYI